MPDFAELLQQGSAHAWLFIPSAILLGALHGLEPGHSKSLMAAFIVAIRGTVGQAILLGLAATVSHTAIVWGLAFGGLYLWQGFGTEAMEPWFQLFSGIVVVAIALWMLWRTWLGRQAGRTAAHAHPHDHGHGHGHGHGHEHSPSEAGVPLDAHARGHAEDIRRRFAGRDVTNGQIAVFGLTGGLVPCPAAVTVLLLCLQLREIAMGAVLVLCFSLGLALTLVTVGATAALGAHYAAQRFTWFSALAGRAPYFSGTLVVAVGIYMSFYGWMAIRA